MVVVLPRAVDADHEDDVRARKAPDVERLGDRREDLLDLLGEDRAQAALVELLELAGGDARRGCASTPRGRGRRRSAPPRYRRASRCRAPARWTMPVMLSPTLSAVFLKPPVRRSSQLMQTVPTRLSPSRPVMRRQPDVAARRRRRCATGAKASLWPLSLFSISTGCVVPTRLSSQAARRIAAASRRRAARALMISRSQLRHARRRRVGPRREGEDVRGDDVAIVEQAQRVQRRCPRSRSGSRRSGRRRSWRRAGPS